MDTESRYHIGTPGVKWGEAEKKQWFTQQQVRREYSDEVLAKLDGIRKDFDVEQYGALSIDSDRYPLFIGHGRRPRLRDQRRAGRTPVSRNESASLC